MINGNNGNNSNSASSLEYCKGYYISEKPIEAQMRLIFKDDKTRNRIEGLEYGKVLFTIRKGTIYNIEITDSIMTDSILKDLEKKQV